MEIDENLCLLQRAAEGDLQARALLVERNTGLVWSIARRFFGRGVESEDLFQIGSIGLLKAIDKFDFSYGVKFSTYAVPLITGELQRYLRDDGIIRVSRTLKEINRKAQAEAAAFCEELGRDPTLAELAERLAIDAEELACAMEAGSEVESLQRPVYGSEGKEIRLMDRLPERENCHERTLNRLMLEEGLAALPEEESRLIILRYFKNRTQMQVAEELGMSQVQVSRTEKKILRKLRKELG